ncbi:hypothetical protein EJ07DRAFT_158568 [Lizonia empirigonia]|nr:hypothetical protein EJ07DRAFT_158568 [Lizonia empirigonia]
MATFTSVPQTTSSQFKYYDPTFLKRTKSKTKAKVTGHTLRRECTEETTHKLGLINQDTEDDPDAVPQLTPQFQAAGHVTEVKELDTAMSCLLREDHRSNVYNLASGDSRYQFDCELLEEGGVVHATRVATSESATDALLDENSQGNYPNFYPVDTAEEHDSAADLQPSNKDSDHQENDYDLTAGNEGDHVSERGDLDAGIKHAFSAGDMESSCHGLPTEDGTFFGTIGLTNRPSATSERSRHSSVIGATMITPAAATDVTLETEPEDARPAKRQRLTERLPQSPMLEPVSALKSTFLLNPSGQASRSIPGPPAAGRKDDGATHLVLPPSDLRDKEDDHDADFWGTIDELLQSRRSISSFEGMEGEQDVTWDADWREMNQHDSLDRIGESFEGKISHNKEGSGIPPAKPRQRVGRDRAPTRKRGLSNTALRPLYYNKVPMGAHQQVKPSRLRQKQMPGRPRINRGLRSCSPQSSSPGATARDGTNINYRSSLDISCEMTDLTLCAIPNGSSVVTATVRYRDSNPSLDPVALGHKFFGKQGKVIRMTQLSPDSWALLGYRCNDSALGLCNCGSLNAEWMSSSHSDAASHRTDHSEDDWNEEVKDGDEVTEVYSRRTYKHWLESDEELLLSLKDKQGMEWKEVCKRFPSRSPGAVKLRYHMLHKKGR